jgi:CMP-N,N'-diacetyllegionaminic acid synthase
VQGDIDVLIPARAGSVGLPGKNRARLGDRSLFLHSVACAQSLDAVRRIFVSTDDPELASEALMAGAFVPELRPKDLATDETPMADVIRYSLGPLEREAGSAAAFLLLLDPTSPLRDPIEIDLALKQIRAQPHLDGCVSVSVPAFNPLWVGVTLDEVGILKRHPATPTLFTRRQDVPAYWRINGNFYAWTIDFARTLSTDWLDRGSFLGVETPELGSHSIDTLSDLQLVEALLNSGTVSLPWMEEPNV